MDDSQKSNKKKSKAGRVILIILLVVIALLAVSTVVNLICCKIEEDKIPDYGTKLEVTGGTMNVAVYGTGNNVVVLLPGSNDPSPGLDFKSLALLLAEEDCTVVIPEPFGYGLSDITDRERSFENIADEIHECLSKLGYTSYTLMGHSLSGITMLQYANSYPDEVAAVVALDTSVPKQVESESLPAAIYNALRFAKVTGLTRLYILFDPSIMGFITDSMSPEDADVCRLLTYARYLNSNTMDELSIFEEIDGPRMYDMKYPDEIPVLTFLAEDSVNGSSGWKGWHEELSENENSVLEILSGDHYIYHNHPEEIASETIQFLNEQK